MPEKTIVLSKEESGKSLFLAGHWWRSWAAKANSLRKSALVLWTVYRQEKKREELLGEAATGQSFDLEHVETAMMLMGMALENLLKCLLIIREPSLVADGKLAQKLKTHDLPILIALAGITIDKYDAQLCKSLTDFIIWQGRYPIPLESTKIRGVFYTVYDWERFDNLYLRIYGSVSEKELAEADRIFSSQRDEFWKTVDKKHSNS